MINIIKNTTNNVTVTLRENQTDLNCYFLFEFVNDFSNVKKYLIGNDISTSIHSYNRFEIIDDINEDPYQSIINFEEGFGRYTVYQMPSMSPLSLSPTYSTATLEKGKYKCYNTINTDIIIGATASDEQNIIL